MLNYEVNDANANAIFIEKLADEDGLKDIRTLARTFIRTRLREKEITRRIIPPQFPSNSELDRLPDSDELVKVIDIEPDAQGAVISFEGAEKYRKLDADSGVVRFYAVESERTETNTSKLKRYEMPVTKLIEDDQVNAIGDATDETFFGAAAQAAINAGQAVGWDDTTNDWIGVTDFTAMMNEMENNRLEIDLIVMSKPTFNNLANLDAAALGMNNEKILVDGYKYENLLGRKILVTTKTNIVPNGYVLGFAAPEYLGKYFITEETKFFIKHEGRDIAWWAWEEKGIGILNEAGACLLAPFGNNTNDYLGTTLALEEL